MLWSADNDGGISMSALYFASYAAIVTCVVLVFGWAQWIRRENEGTPCKLKFLKVASVVGVLLWAAAGITAWVAPDGDYGAEVMIASAIGIVITVGFAVMMVRIRKAYDARRFS